MASMREGASSVRTLPLAAGDRVLVGRRTLDVPGFPYTAPTLYFSQRFTFPNTGNVSNRFKPWTSGSYVATAANRTPD